MNAGQRIKERRKELQMTVAALARAAGIAPSTLYDLERGDAQASTRMHALCQTLGLNPQWVETGAGARLANGKPLQNAVEIVIGGERLTPESARLAAQIERLDEVVRKHVEGMIASLVDASQNQKK